MSRYSCDARWLSLASPKLKVSILPVRPSWYCKQVPSGLNENWRLWLRNLQCNCTVHVCVENLLGLLHSTCVTLMSQALAVVVSEKVRASVAVLATPEPISTYTGGGQEERKVATPSLSRSVRARLTVLSAVLPAQLRNGLVGARLQPERQSSKACS